MGRMKRPSLLVAALFAAAILPSPATESPDAPVAPAQPTENPSADKPVVVEITGDRVNLRAAPRLEAEVVGQASLGETFVLRGDPGEAWVAVAIPQRCDTWIRTDLARGGKVGVEGARLRAGAGIQYSIVGTLPLGTELDVRGSLGDWTKVAPPDLPTVAVYVTNAYVKVLEEAPVAAPPPPAAAPIPPPPLAPAPVVAPIPPPPAPAPDGQRAVRPDKPIPDAAPLRDEVPAAAPEAPPPPRPVPPPPPASDKGRSDTLLSPRGESVPVGPAKIPSSRLRSDKMQASDGVFAGVLARAPAFGVSPTRFRLVRFDRHNAVETVCWVYGNSKQLEGLRDAPLTVSGAVYWFKGADLPVVFAQEILTGGAVPAAK